MANYGEVEVVSNTRHRVLWGFQNPRENFPRILKLGFPRKNFIRILKPPSNTLTRIWNITSRLFAQVKWGGGNFKIFLVGSYTHSQVIHGQCLSNKPFPSCFMPRDESEAWCTQPFTWKCYFVCMWNHFHMKGCAPSLAFTCHVGNGFAGCKV